MRLFGIKIGEDDDEGEIVRSPVAPEQEESSLDVWQGGVGAAAAKFMSLGGTVENENQLISKYREISMNPEVDKAIEEIISDAIVTDEREQPVKLDLSELKVQPAVQEAIQQEFEKILTMLKFKLKGHDIFRRWYVDGRLNYHMVIDEANPANGIQELRYIDPRKIKKVREIVQDRSLPTDEFWQMNVKYEEYYIFNEAGVNSGNQSYISQAQNAQIQGVKIAADSIAHVNSGLFDSSGALILSYVHKAIRPLNLMKMVEDAIVVYRITRSSEKRVFYIDVGSLPKPKAEQEIKALMNKFKTKLHYNPETGEVKDERRHIAITEDFWLPRRGDGKTTEITTLPAGQTLGQIDDVEYFRKKLWESLNIPLSRMNAEAIMGFGPGQVEILRDEIKFSKFIARLRNKFNSLFNTCLKTQMVLKQMITSQEWEEEIEPKLVYDYLRDDHFAEMRELEMTNMRLNTLNLIAPYVDMYFTRQWIQRKVLRQTDEEISEADAAFEEMQKEAKKVMKKPISESVDLKRAVDNFLDTLKE